jgi:hypothetical protein
LLTARSAALGRKRVAGVFIAWWAVFWAGNVLSPCCNILAAAVPHGHSLHWTMADDDQIAGGHVPHPNCATIVDVDMLAPNVAPLLVAKLQLPDVLWLPAATVLPSPIRQSDAFHTGYPQPLPLLRLYLRTSRLLI